MNTIQTDGVIFKTDTLGRVKTPAARRELLLDEFERSGMSGRQFAEFVGIKYQTFATWAQHRRRRRKSSANLAHPKPPIQMDAPNPLRWLEAVVEQAPPAVPAALDQNISSLLIHLPGGARVELLEPKQVALAAALVRALAQPQPALPC